MNNRKNWLWNPSFRVQQYIQIVVEFVKVNLVTTVSGKK